MHGHNPQNNNDNNNNNNYNNSSSNRSNSYTNAMIDEIIDLVTTLMKTPNSVFKIKSIYFSASYNIYHPVCRVWQNLTRSRMCNMICWTGSHACMLFKTTTSSKVNQSNLIKSVVKTFFVSLCRGAEKSQFLCEMTISKNFSAHRWKLVK